MPRLRPAITGIALAALATGCSTSPSSPVTTTIVTVTAPAPAASSAPPATASTRPTVTSIAPPPVTPSASAGAGFDTLPPGYSYAHLKAQKQVNGRWAVVLDPLTMCISNVSKDEVCKGLKMETEWQIVNVNPKTYTVPLAPGVKIQLLASGQPDDYVPIDHTARVWPADPNLPQMIVTYLADPQSQVTSVKQWWHP